MWFFHRIHFRIIAGAVLLVCAVVLILNGYVQNQNRNEMRNRAVSETLAQTNLRAREIASELQTLGEGVVQLVNTRSLRTLQWRTQLAKEISEPLRNEQYPLEKFAEMAAVEKKTLIETDFREFLKSHHNCLRAEYYFINTKTNTPPERMAYRDRDGLPDYPLRDPDPTLVERLSKNPTAVSFSPVLSWEGDGPAKGKAVLQVGFPVNFASVKAGLIGFVVVTLDFQQVAESLTRSPRYLLFLAGENKVPLLYPRAGRAASQILTREEAEKPECQKFAQEWLTDDTDLSEDSQFRSTFPLYYRYKPGKEPEGRGDAKWLATPDLRFHLLRIRVRTRYLKNEEDRKQLSDRLKELQARHSQLVVSREVQEGVKDYFIRGPEQEDALLRRIRDGLEKEFGARLEFPDGQPIACTEFVRSLFKYKLSLAGGVYHGPGEPCFYVALAAPLEEIDADIANAQYSSWWVVLACVLGAAVLAVGGSFLLTRPLGAITRATQEIAAGKTDVCLPVKDPTEIGALARSFAAMLTQIQDRQQEVLEREARLTTILDSAADAILTVRENGSIRLFNKAAEKLFGYSSAEIVGEPLTRILDDPTLAGEGAQGMERLGERLGSGALGESVGRRKDGTTFPLEYGGNRVPLPNRTVITLILRDLTDRKQAEEAGRRRRAELEACVAERTQELETANHQLAEAAVAKDLFLANVSHELRTPLNHVIGFIQLLELTPLDDEQLRDLGKIHYAAHHLLALVNDLLDYQKIIQGALPLEPTDFALPAWVEQVADAMRPKVAEKGNRLEIDCPADIGAVHADEKRVQQALTNLLHNAAKFTRNGVVTVAARRETDEAGAHWVWIDVRDSGRGMTAEQQKLLFQPFAKLVARSENPEGTGLGLALSQKLCRLMGGDLILTHSAPDQGSTFSIRLPAAGTAPSARTAPAALVRPTPVGSLVPTPKLTTVLVIDDDPDVRELMRRHLEKQGFVIHTADSGAAALDMVKRIRPDAITLDVLMPGIDGWGTLAALQADTETANIPVILITMMDDRTRGFALGAWEYLPKPIDWSRLIDLLRHVEPSTGPVLLIDDDPKFRELAGRTLQQQGWDVICAADGQEGLEMAARRRPSLVLLDLIMPGMDGYAFLEAFRREPVWREVPVVVLTARDLSAEERGRLGDSVQKILFKGMGTLQDTLREVEWLLNNHAVPGALAEEPVAVTGGPA